MSISCDITLTGHTFIKVKQYSFTTPIYDKCQTQSEKSFSTTHVYVTRLAPFIKIRMNQHVAIIFENWVYDTKEYDTKCTTKLKQTHNLYCPIIHNDLHGSTVEDAHPSWKQKYLKMHSSSTTDQKIG